MLLTLMTYTDNLIPTTISYCIHDKEGRSEQINKNKNLILPFLLRSFNLGTILRITRLNAESIVLYGQPSHSNSPRYSKTDHLTQNQGFVSSAVVKCVN